MRPVIFHSVIVPELNSTNLALMEMRNEEDFAGKILVARKQTAGMGRRGRSWLSPNGNLACSIGLKFGSGESEDLLWIGPWLSVLTFDLVHSYLLPMGLEQLLTLKWPNDLYYGDRKLAGILTQTRQQGENLFVVVGIGLNLECSPAVIDSDVQAISLWEIGANKITLDTIVENLRVNLQNRFPKFGDRVLRLQEWTNRAKFLGQQVQVIEGDHSYLAQAMGIEKDGSLLVKKTDGSTQKLSSEEISIRL